MWGMIATWRMALEGVEMAGNLLEDDGAASEALVKAIKEVEDFEYYKSVGYGGLPNEEMEVELDAAYMNGDTFAFGAVGAIKDFANPIEIACKLSSYEANNFLVGAGAEKFAHHHGFERKNMLTERAKTHYHNRKVDLAEMTLKPYAGHDTVGMVCLDSQGSMQAGTSTSGLFMKKAGRVGDSPVIGSGLYVDSDYGGASATGLGEDMIKGCVSYEVVRLLKEGYHPQAACEKVVGELDAKLKGRQGRAGDISIVALNNQGEWGCATNIDGFSFVVATATTKPTVYIANRQGTRMEHVVASDKWLEEYMAKRTAPLEKK